MNIFKSPRIKALAATITVAGLAILGISGLVYCMKSWPNATFTVVLTAFITIYGLSVYNSFLQKYTKEQE